MKRNIIHVWLMLFLAPIISLSAQQKTITGQVIDSDGVPLPGVNVVIKGTTTGVQSDFDGNYSIVANEGQVLVFSYLGQTTEEREITQEDIITVQMAEDTQALEEVVVTAQGIKREKRSLGYSVSTVDTEGIQEKPESDVARILSGKVAGVNITSTNGMSGSGTNIIIRGYSTINQSNQPLFVVDGVPFDSGSNNQSNFLDNNTESSRFLDLDPNSIESVSVLKGLSATVLYGSQGRNGVILITTKNSTSGDVKKKTEVSITQSTFFSKANLPVFTDNYGGGFHQGFGYFFSNWGPRFDRTDDDAVSLAPQYLGDGANGVAILQHPFNFIADPTLITGFEDLLDDPYPYKPYNSVEEFFRTGTVITTSINVRGGGENANFNVNYGRTDDKGVTPGNGLIRNAFSLGGNATLTNKINVSGVFNFTNTNYRSPPNGASTGSGVGFDGSGVFGDVLYTPISVDLTNIPFQAADGRSVYYRSANDIQNPYWTVINSKVIQDTDRFNANLSVGYEIEDWLNLTYRLGLDTYTEANEYGQNRGGVDGDITGLYRTSYVKNTIWNHDIIFSADKDLTDDLNLQVILGANARKDIYSADGLESTNQLAFGILKHWNFTTKSSVNSFSGLDIQEESQTNQVGVYLDATLGLKEYLYLNIVSRNDWTSTLERENNSLFYPGASISFIPTSAFANMQSNTLSYLKLRFGYGSSAGFPGAFNTRNVLDLNARSIVDANGNVISTNSVSNTLGNADLKPERVTEFEVGVDSRLFNRLNFNVSVYKKTTEDLITTQSLDNSTGFSNTLVNLGEIQSQGIELDYDLNVIKGNNEGFSWNIAGNFTTNETTVTDLAEGTDNIPLTTFVIGNAANYAVEGRPFGVLLGSTIQRNADGARIVGNDGKYLVDPNISEIGDPNPDWTTSVIPRFSYKGLTLSGNLQYRHVGDIFSTTATTLIGRGVVEADEPIDRLSNYILPGVLQNGQPNNIAITATNVGFDTYYSAGSNESYIFDGTTIRLQELSLSYSFPDKILENTPFGTISFSLIGQNLWYRAVNFDNNLNYDTNQSSTGVGNGQGIDYITGPSTKRYGFSLRATF